MFKTVLCSTLALVGGSAIVCFADAKDDAAQAAQKLADAQNYSWKQTVENAGGGGGGGGGRGGFGFGGNFEGKTEKGGVTAIMREVNGETRTSYMKGDKTVVQNQDGEWMTMEEMMAARGGGNGNANAGGGGRRRGRGGAAPALQHPAEAVVDLVSKATGLAMSDGAISGALPEDAVKPMLIGGGRGGRRGANATPPEISNAKGTLKIWTKDGVISKYETHITGTVSVNGNDRDVDRTTSVEVSNVGSTKIEVPEAAAKKLG